MMSETNFILLQVLLEEVLDLVVRDHAGDIIVKIHMGRSGDDKHFFIALFGAFSNNMPSSHALEGILAEVAAVSLLAMNKKHWSLDLLRPSQKWLVQKTLATDNVPAVIGVAAALRIAALGLVLSGIVFDKPWSVLRKRIDDTAGTLISS